MDTENSITFRPLLDPDHLDPEGKDPVWTDYGPGTITIHHSAIEWEWEDSAEKYAYDINDCPYLISIWAITYFKTNDRSIPPRDGWLLYYIDFTQNYPEGDEPFPRQQITPEYAARWLRKEGAKVPPFLAELVSQRSFQQPEPPDPRQPVICSRAGLGQFVGLSRNYGSLLLEQLKAEGRISNWEPATPHKIRVWFTSNDEHARALEYFHPQPKPRIFREGKRTKRITKSRIS
jgi:hypothetical protein